MESFANMLGALGGSAFRWSALGFLLVNGIAAAAVFVTKDRSLVNRWTTRLLVIDALLIGTGVGIPAVAYSMKLIVQAAAVADRTEVHIKTN